MGETMWSVISDLFCDHAWSACSARSNYADSNKLLGIIIYENVSKLIDCATWTRNFNIKSQFQWLDVQFYSTGKLLSRRGQEMKS